MKHIYAGILVAALIVPSLAAAQKPPTAAEAVAGSAVIPRSALFGNPEKTQARLSPDGKYLSYIAPRDGVLNVWLAPRGEPDNAKPITNDQKRGIRQHFWAYDNKHVLFVQDEGGDENFHLYAVDVVTGTQKDLTPYKGIQAQVVGLSWKKPGVVGRGAQRPRARVARPLGSESNYRQARADRAEHAGDSPATISTSTSSRKLATKNTADGGEFLRRVGRQVGQPAQVRPGGFADHRARSASKPAAPPRCCSLRSGRDKSALVRVDLATGKTTVLGASEQADVESVWTRSEGPRRRRRTRSTT